MDQADTGVTGGCQCGAVRFRVEGDIQGTSLCHCRMCQKAYGGLFGVVATVREADLVWTRGEPAHFRSSSLAVRGFCAQCGTPLTYAFDGAGQVAISLGAYDDPNRFGIEAALEVANAHPMVSRIPDIPAVPTASSPEEKQAFSQLRSFQHPDHDTGDWPPREGEL